jgi:acyl-CoA thioesterase
VGQIDPFIVEHAMDEPSLAWFGFTINEASDGVAVVTATVNSEQVNGNGVAHGGLVFALADQAFAMAANTVIQYAVTADAQISYLAPAMTGDRLTATARVSYSDDRRAIVDVVVSTEVRALALYRGTARAARRS